MMSEINFILIQKWYETLCHPKMHPYTKFSIWFKHILLARKTDVYSIKVTRIGMVFLSQAILEMCSGQDYSRNELRGQSHSGPDMVPNTLPSQDASTYQRGTCIKRLFCPPPPPL